MKLNIVPASITLLFGLLTLNGCNAVIGISGPDLRATQAAAVQPTLAQEAKQTAQVDMTTAVAATLVSQPDPGAGAAVRPAVEAAMPAPWWLSRECEDSNESTTGQMVWRSNASGSQVHGQFGASAVSPWPAVAGYVKYNNIFIPATDRLYLTVRYSKHSPASAPILVYLGDEPSPRATFYPQDQGDWNRFASTEPLLLGSIGSGIYSIKFYTDGQKFGVADLDMFVLTAGLPAR